MPTVIDLQALGDASGTVEVVASALLAGDYVGLPLETTYIQAFLPDWVKPRQYDRFRGDSATLIFRDFDSVDDLAGPISGKPLRLLRRCWPGTPVVEFGGLDSDSRLASLPQGIREALFQSGRVRVTVPRHEFVHKLLQHLPGPLVASLPTRDRWPSAREAFEVFGSAIDMLVDDGPTQYDQSSTVVRVSDADVRVVEEGVVSAKAIERMAGEVLVFVCTGNTCRSPMAEAVGRRLLARRLNCADDELLDHGFAVLSAGLAAGRGVPASPEAVDLLDEQGIDLRTHESQPLTRALLEQADRVITMTRGHRDSIVAGMPEFAPKVRVLSSSGRDIADPIGGGEHEYRECLKQISACLDVLLDEILAGNGGASQP
jgi:protein-tyrosine phosphatase